jgi:hypothetical protein
MYNPKKKVYWGYWDADSLLPAEKRKESIDNIAAEDFPKPGKAPAIPEAGYGVAMDAPPGEFPSIEDKPERWPTQPNGLDRRINVDECFWSYQLVFCDPESTVRTTGQSWMRGFAKDLLQKTNSLAHCIQKYTNKMTE